MSLFCCLTWSLGIQRPWELFNQESNWQILDLQHARMLSLGFISVLGLRRMGQEYFAEDCQLCLVQGMLLIEIWLEWQWRCWRIINSSRAIWLAAVFPADAPGMVQRCNTSVLKGSTGFKAFFDCSCRRTLQNCMRLDPRGRSFDWTCEFCLTDLHMVISVNEAHMLCPALLTALHRN